MKKALIAAGLVVALFGLCGFDGCELNFGKQLPHSGDVETTE